MSIRLLPDAGLTEIKDRRGGEAVTLALRGHSSGRSEDFDHRHQRRQSPGSLVTRRSTSRRGSARVACGVLPRRRQASDRIIEESAIAKVRVVPAVRLRQPASIPSASSIAALCASSYQAGLDTAAEDIELDAHMASFSLIDDFPA